MRDEDDLDRALALVLHQSSGHFAGSRPAALVDAAEAALGVSFPPTYRRFLEKAGAGSFGSREFYGVIDENFDHSSVPNGIWLTLKERTDLGMPAHLVIVGETGIGDYYVLDTSRRNPERECPVALWAPGTDTDPLEVVASDFGSFFLTTVGEALGQNRP